MSAYSTNSALKYGHREYYLGGELVHAEVDEGLAEVVTIIEGHEGRSGAGAAKGAGLPPHVLRRPPHRPPTPLLHLPPRLFVRGLAQLSSRIIHHLE
jgi:hypothetical protein